MYRRIDQRCEQMARSPCFLACLGRCRVDDPRAHQVTEGILLEALELRKEGVTPDSCNAARAIGYRQALEFAYSNVWEMVKAPC